MDDNDTLFINVVYDEELGLILSEEESNIWRVIFIFKINGTQIHYYFHCKTQLWLFSHNIQMEQESDIVALGKQLHENSYKREKEFLIDDLINVDFIKNKNPIEIHEVKKSSVLEEWLMNFNYYIICII